MTPALLSPLEILKAREKSRWPEIEHMARLFYDEYTVDAEHPWESQWERLTEPERLPWWLAAERHMTAQRIARHVSGYRR